MFRIVDDGYEIIETKGLVRGIIVRSPTISQGILGGLKNIIGGRIGAYTEMCEQTRAQAYDEMVRHATETGANAIVGVRYDASAACIAIYFPTNPATAARAARCTPSRG